MEAILKQFEIAGIDPSFLGSGEIPLFKTYQISSSQREAWKRWFISEVRSRFKMKKREAEEEFIFFSSHYGFTVQD
jgi:hypothetical protein